MHDIHKSFGATKALQGVGFSVYPGEVHALVGENGAGKSTLMKVLSGAIRSDQGQMLLDDEPFRPRNPLDGRRRGVAMIYQELSLAPHLTVMENIFLGMEPTRFMLVDWAKLRRLAAEALHELEHDDIPPDALVKHLSPGDCQLVEIARAIAVGCQVLVLDEPTSSLTLADTERLFQLIARLKDQGMAIVYISHFLEEVKAVSDRFTVLRDGCLAGQGETVNASIPRIVSMMVGRDVDDIFPRSEHHPGKIVLQCSHLAGRRKPESTSLALRSGEVVGIAGLVGAGRTEFLRALFGLDPIREGTISVGAFSGRASPGRRWRQGVGMVSEDRKQEGIALGLSIGENIVMSNQKGLGPKGLVLPSRRNEAAAQWIDALGIRCRSPEQKVLDLSGGNQQKVALARLLHHDVDVFLLDEPTRGIDVGAKATIYQWIDDLATGKGTSDKRPRAILMVSSYLPELMGVCDRIAVMCRGRLGPLHLVEDVSEHDLMLEATGATESQKAIH
jgi:ribose transport system ATP-binding protein